MDRMPVAIRRRACARNIGECCRTAYRPCPFVEGYPFNSSSRGRSRNLGNIGIRAGLSPVNSFRDIDFVFRDSDDTALNFAGTSTSNIAHHLDGAKNCCYRNSQLPSSLSTSPGQNEKPPSTLQESGTSPDGSTRTIDLGRIPRRTWYDERGRGEKDRWWRGVPGQKTAPRKAARRGPNTR